MYSTEDLVGKGDVIFVCTGASNGDLVSGVELVEGGALTHSVCMSTDVEGINRVEMYYDKSQIRQCCHLVLQPCISQRLFCVKIIHILDPKNYPIFPRVDSRGFYRR